MMDYVYEGCDPTGELEKIVKDSQVFPLVRELRFKYGMSVTGQIQPRYSSGDKSAFLMAKDDGINICKVFVEQGNDGLDYCYHSPYYEKERGSDHFDRRTIRSKRLATLMATLKKHEVVPENVLVQYSNMRAIEYGVASVCDSVGSAFKNDLLNFEQEHALLRAVFRGEDINSFPDELLNKCKQALERHDKTVDTIGEITKKRDAFFNRCYVALSDGTGTLITGIVKISRATNTNGGNGLNLNILSPFKRTTPEGIKERYPELASYLTMLKVYNEENGNASMSCGIPLQSKYIEALDTALANVNSPDGFFGAWMFTPCGGNDGTNT